MITVKVDASKALARFSPTGIPEAVRRNLRAAIPDLTKRLGAQIEANLSSGLKSRRRLQVKKEMVESPTEIVGRVTTIATSPPPLLPLWLEAGTRPHEIVARRSKALFFFWDKLGRNVAFRRVMHPGFAGIQYSERAFAGMRGEVRAALEEAVKAAVRAA